MNLEELERLAKEATPGPWIYDEINSCIDCHDDYYIAYDLYTDADGGYIAAANPKVILGMIEEIKRLGGEVDFLAKKTEKLDRECYELQKENDNLFDEIRSLNDA